MCSYQMFWESLTIFIAPVSEICRKSPQPRTHVTGHRPVRFGNDLFHNYYVRYRQLWLTWALGRGGRFVLWMKVEFECNVWSLPNLFRIKSRARHLHDTPKHKQKLWRHENHEDYSNTGEFLIVSFVGLFSNFALAGAMKRATDKGSRNW